MKRKLKPELGPGIVGVVINHKKPSDHTPSMPPICLTAKECAEAGYGICWVMPKGES